MLPDHPLGLHRVIEPHGSLPQAAVKIDNSETIRESEILIDVDILNITSASFARLKNEFNRNISQISSEILSIVNSKGKYQDPVLGSGGMLIGTVSEIGQKAKEQMLLNKGQRIATLISLSATPLRIDHILKMNLNTDQVWVKGKAILFEKSLYAVLPDDLSEEIALAVMDVAGAPAIVAKSVKEGDTVLIVGGGKAGLLSMHEAKKRSGITGKVIVIEKSKKRCQDIIQLGLADQAITADVQKPIEVLEQVAEATDNQLADFTLNVVNVDNSEMASILATKDTGKIYFFNTSTSFIKAALGAESVGKATQMLIGNGYVPGHAEVTFQVLRENTQLKNYFQSIYSNNSY